MMEKVGDGRDDGLREDSVGAGVDDDPVINACSDTNLT